MKAIKFALSLVIGISSIGAAYSQDYIAIAKEGNVYDEANAKYITVNQYNDDVAVIPGMVFLTTEHNPGWYKIEYSPGLHAFIPDQIAASSFKPVVAGTYNIQNNSGKKIDVSGSDNQWNGSVDGKSYKGKMVGDILIFLDDSNKPAFSLVDFGSGPIAITYDNSVTKFF
ncbi:MAG: hypothetical protein J1F38_01920 [Muribaculaceae bacterium]|nr:hypothetical protein [Muribaculaceae bacterium]